MSFENSSALSDAQLAKKYVGTLVNHRCEADGIDPVEAMRRVGRQIGVGYWTLWGIIQERTKTPRCLTELRLAYIALLERKVTAMTNEIDVERKLGRGDDELEGIAVALSALAEKVAAKKRLWARA